MIATHDYFLFSNEIEYLESIWPKYIDAMNFILSKVDSTGLLNVTGTSGWGRSASAAGYSTIGNMLMYGTLKTGERLATWMNETNLAKDWRRMAANLKATINSPSYNWDSDSG